LRTNELLDSEIVNERNVTMSGVWEIYDISGNVHVYNRKSGRLIRLRLGGEAYKIEYAQSLEMDQVTDANKVNTENLIADLLNRGYLLEPATDLWSQAPPLTNLSNRKSGIDKPKSKSSSSKNVDYRQSRFPCGSCSRRFSTKQAVANHRLTHVRKRMKPKFLCEVCKADFKTRSNLNRHRREVHKLPGKQLEDIVTICQEDAAEKQPENTAVADVIEEDESAYDSATHPQTTEADSIIEDLEAEQSNTSAAAPTEYVQLHAELSPLERRSFALRRDEAIALMDKNATSLVSALWKDECVRDEMLQQTVLAVEAECASLCSTVVDSVFFETNINKLSSVTFESALDELRKRAPITLKLISTISTPTKPSRRVDPTAAAEIRNKSLVISAAILLKSRNVQACAFQLKLGLMLKHFGLSVRGINMLSAINLSVHNNTLGEKRNDLETDYSI